MTDFMNYVRAAAPVLPRLPVIHTCDAYAFRQIIEDGHLTPQPCSVFQGESLLYLFYARPAYRLGNREDGQSQVAHFPVSLVLHPDAPRSIHRIAPFDTGAFVSGRFARHFHPNMKCEDFLLDAEADTPARLVEAFYGSNKEYFAGRAKSIEIAPSRFEVASYRSLISDAGGDSYDDRRDTIEIQLTDELELSSDTVMAVALPGVLLEEPSFQRRILDEWQATPLPYSTHRAQPNEFVGRIFADVEHFLASRGLLD